MQKLSIAPLLTVLLVACEAQDNFPVRFSHDSGTQSTGSGGSGGSTTGGMSGSAVTTGAGGSSGTSGSNSQGGSGGTGGTPVSDASSDVAAMVDSSTPADTGGGAGGGYPDASTCAGYSVVFNGFAYGTISSRPVQDDFTIEAWIKTTDARTGANNFFEGSGLIYADVPGVHDDYGSSVLNGKFAFGVGNPDTTLMSTTTVNTGQWIHVAGTRKMSTGEIQLFVNGTMEASQTVATQTRSLTASVSMSLGANVVDNRYFTGEMDEVRIWSTVRTQGEISANMGKRMTGNEAGLAGYYRFDSPGSDTAKDLSSKMGDATLIGPDWAVSAAPVCN
jgi:hypothetical protein